MTARVLTTDQAAGRLAELGDRGIVVEVSRL
jgi:hypothetical protein